jgi:general secretion pathway protein D
MRLGFSTRIVAAVALAVTLFLTCVPVLAASQLSGVVVTPARGGAARVVLTFAGGAPTGWSVTGAGTQTPIVLLPGTTQAAALNQSSYTGSGGVSSVSVAQSGGTLTVTLHLTSALRIASRLAAGAIIVDVAAPKVQATPPPLPFPLPSTGDVGSGEHYEVIPLKYADVSEVVGLLVQGQQVTPNDIFSPETSIFSLPTSSSGLPSTSGGSPFSPETNQQNSVGERVNDNIGYDRRLNAVILYGSGPQIAQYKQFIAAIDVPVPSVMLECAVLELDETAAKNLGIDFTNANGAIATGSANLGPNNSAITGTTSGLTAQLQASLYATIQHGGGKILATPRILALNGESAQILSGDALPIASTTTIPGAASAITQSTINYIAVGINMQIQPRIDASGYVTSHIYAEASSVTAYVNSGGQSVPEVSLRQVNTEATVQDGQPFIVGGLLLDEEIANLTKIPVLGDIPLIGGIFRYRNETTQRTNLYIIITPHIIRRVGEPNEPVPSLPIPKVPGPLPSFPDPPTPTPVLTTPGPQSSPAVQSTP